MSGARWELCRVGGTNEEVIPLRERLFCIGSGSDNDLVLIGKKISTVALKLEPVSGAYRCTCVGGKNACVNGKKISSVVLSNGDRITLGEEQLVINMVEQPAAENRNDRLMGNLKRYIDAVGKERELRPLLDTMLRILLKITGGTDSFLFTLDTNGVPLLFVSSGKGDATERFSDTIVQTVIEKKEGVCVANALADPAFKRAQSIADLKLRSALCTPIMSAGKIVGVVYVGSANPVVSFTHDDLSDVTLYASIAGMLIRHVDFMASQQRTIERLSGSGMEDGVVAGCNAMRMVTDAVHAVAATDITVLLEGETGTGKNRIAELLHSRSRRSENPFIVVNCSALHGELLESELFGHKKGSFTGAVTDHRGLFAAADGGTLLLDEIGELDVSLQSKLLRALETGAIRPIGASGEQPVNVRILCATNRDLLAMVQQGAFRADLYYRINQFGITVPPLRDRGDDIELIALLLLNRLKLQYPEKDIQGFTPASLVYLHTHTWPGNIRELSNMLHRAVLTTQSPLVTITQEPSSSFTVSENFENAVQAFQKSYLERAIREAGGNKERAAGNIGLSRSTFYRYLSQVQ